MIIPKRKKNYHYHFLKSP